MGRFIQPGGLRLGQESPETGYSDTLVTVEQLFDVACGIHENKGKDSRRLWKFYQQILSTTGIFPYFSTS
nr:hypothetical protein [Flavobacterium sp. N1718]